MGRTFLLTYRYLDGSLQAAFPLHAVTDRAEVRAGWLLAGSEVSYWATADGADPRDLPLDARFAVPLGTTRRRWEGADVLRVMPAGVPYQVLRFWRDGAPLGWYVNFESPARWADGVAETRDWHLDIWIDAEGQAVWKDEDEAEEACTWGHALADELATARRVGHRIVSAPDTWLEHLSEWGDLPPPTHLAPLELPAVGLDPLGPVAS